MSETTTIDAYEVEAIAREAQEPGLLATKLVLRQVGKRHEKLAFHLAETISNLCGSRDTRLRAASRSDFHHYIGNLAAIDLDVKDKKDGPGVAAALEAMAASTEGTQSAAWLRMSRLFGDRQDRENDGRGNIATVDGRTPARRATKDLGTLLDLTALTYPTGIDLLDPSGTSDRIQTLDASVPATISYGVGDDDETIRIAPFSNRPESRISWTWHDEEYLEPKQVVLVEGDLTTVGLGYDLIRCFGVRLKTMVGLPIDVDLGEHPTAPILALVRLRGRIAVLLRRPRGPITVEQGDTYWRFDPSIPHEDTYGVTERHALRTALDTDGSEDEDTLLEP